MHRMQIDWLKLVPAILLLIIPLGLFHGRKVRFRSLPSGFDSYWSRVFALGSHTVDLLRAALGAWLLVEAITLSPDLKGPLRFVPPGVQAVTLVVAMILQTFVCKETDAANPPYAFALGMVLGFLPPLVAGFALFVGVMAAFGVRSVGGFFPLLAIAVMAACQLFSQYKINLYSQLALA